QGGGPGGGGFGGGGQRGRPTGGGAMLPPDPRGPDFFVQAVKDDPQHHILFDPQNDEATGLQAIGSEEQQQPETQPPTGTEIRAPRSTVNAYGVPELGGLIISASSKEDLEIIRQIIAYLSGEAAKAEVVIRLYPLRQADATSVTNILTQVFS